MNALNYYIKHSVRSFAAVTCSGWVFVLPNGEEVTVSRSGTVIQG